MIVTLLMYVLGVVFLVLVALNIALVREDQCFGRALNRSNSGQWTYIQDAGFGCKSCVWLNHKLYDRGET